MAEHSASLKIIAAACGMGAPDGRCALGPEAVLRALRQQPEPRLEWHRTVAPADTNALVSFAPFIARLARETELLFQREPRIAVLSGDHSCAMGAWRGVRSALAGPLGLIWVDAHMDAHTPATSPSGYWHGMPVANLLGHGDIGSYVGNAVVIAPQHLCLLGVRSYEAKEQQLLRDLGVRVITMDELRRIGFAAAMAEAVAIASNGTQGYGISVDLDGIDPSDAPGVGSPVVGGIAAADLLMALKTLAEDPDFKVVEVAEFNPVVDVEQRTLKLVMQILKLISGAEDESDH